MRIEVSEQVTRHVVISEKQQKEVTLAYLHKLFSIPERFTVKDGSLYEVIEVYTSHSWSEEHFVRDCTHLDYQLVKVIWEIEKLYRAKLNAE